MKKLILLVIILFSFIGCATIDWEKKYSECEGYGKSWIGFTEHDLILKWGNSKYKQQSDGAGGKIITYLIYAHINEYGGKQILYIDFYLNKDSKIYHHRCFYGS